MNWKKEHIDFIRAGLKDGSTLAQLAKALSKKTGEAITPKALSRAWENNKDRKWPAFKTRENFSTHTARRMDSGVLFVTAAVPFAKPGKGVLGALDNFCKKNKAELIVLPMREHARPGAKQRYYYHPDVEPLISNSRIVVNKHLTVMDLRLNPQRPNPLTGLWRICGKDRTRSFVVAHTKQALQLVPAKLEGLPRMLHTTGCMTLPKYNLDESVGFIAETDHVMGGLIIYIEGDTFYPVAVQFDEDGGFYDPAGTYYSAEGAEENFRPAATKWGDFHAGNTDYVARNAAVNILRYTQPERLFLEDFVDGFTVNHHEKDDVVKQAQRHSFPAELTTLHGEAFVARMELGQIKDAAPSDCEIVVTDSNHNDFIDRYIRRGKWLTDSQNAILAAKLFIDMAEHHASASKALVDKEGKLATWLEPNKDYFVAGVQMAAHGHQGINGSKGSPKAMEYAFGNVMSGHTHSPSITHGGMVVGTLSLLRQGYNNGPSNWLHAIGHVWPNGQKMLIFIINGRTCYHQMGVIK